MKKILAGSAVVVALVAGGFASAFASDHSVQPPPGSPDCHGQVIAFLAQATKNGVVDGAFHGIGGIGRIADMSVPQVQEVVRAYCAQ
jgi:hypothetical protein